MTPRLVPLNEGLRFIRESGLQERFDENPQQTVNEINAYYQNRGQNLDFSELINAPKLRQWRGELADWTERNYNNWVREPVYNKFGENSATRILTAAGEGILQSIPDFIPMIVTRGRGNIGRFLGTGTSAYSAGASTYNETADPASAMASVVGTALVPGVTSGLTGAAKRVFGSGSRLRDAALGGLVGGATGLGQDIVESGFMPNVDVEPLTRDIQIGVPNERVSLTDIGGWRSRVRDRFDVTTREGLENLAVIALSEFAPSAVGALQEMGDRRLANVVRERSKDAALNEVNTNPRNELGESGLDVPDGIAPNIVDMLYKQYDINPADKPLIQRKLYEAVPESQLTREQKNALDALRDPSRFDQEALKAAYEANSNRSAGDDTWDRIQVAVANAVGDMTPAPNKPESYLSRLLNKGSRWLFDSTVSVQTNPMARAINDEFGTMQARIDDDKAKLFQTLSPDSVSPEDAVTKVAGFFSRYQKNVNNLKSIQDQIADERQQSMYQEVTKVRDDGTTYTERVRRNPYDDVPVLTVEERIQRGMSPEDAAISYNIDMLSTRLAIDSYNTMHNITINKLAQTIKQSIPDITLADARAKAAEIAQFAKILAGESIAEKQAIANNSFNPNESRGEEGRALALGDKILKTLYNGNEAYRNIANRLGSVSYSMELGNLMQYAKNKREGYMPAIRRGKYKLAWTEPDGTEGFSGFDSQAERQNFIQSLRSRGVSDIKEIGDFRDKKEYISAEAFNKISELKQNIDATINRLSRLSPNVEGLEGDAATKLASELRQAIDEFRAEYDKSASQLSGADITKLTQLERKNIAGARPADYLPNLFELVEATTRSNVRRETSSVVRMMLEDDSFKTDPDLRDYLQARLNYLNDPNTSEMAAARTLVSLNFLAGSASFITNNLLQIPMIGSGLWRLHTGRGLGDFTSSLVDAMRMYSDYVHHTDPKSMNKIIRSFMARAQKENRFDIYQTAEMFALDQAMSDYSEMVNPSTKSRLKRIKDNLLYYATLVPRAVETTNRATAFLQYLNSENKARAFEKMSPAELEQVYKDAVNYSDAVNYRGGKATRAGLFMGSDGVGGRSKLRGGILASFSLLNYVRNMFGTLVELGRDAIPGARDKSYVRSKRYRDNMSRRAALTGLGAVIAIAGFSGVPGTNLLDNVLAELFGEEERPSKKFRDGINGIAKTISDDPNAQEYAMMLSDALQYGIPSIADIYFPGTAVDNIVPFDPRDTLIGNMGAFGSMLEAYGKAGKSLFNRDFISAWNEIKPTAIKQLDRASNALFKGKAVSGKGKVYAQNLTIPEQIATAMGASSLKAQKQRDAEWHNIQGSRQLADRKRSILDSLAILAKQDGGNPAALAQRIQELVNDGKITFNTVQDAVDFYKSLANRTIPMYETAQASANSEERNLMHSIFNSYGIPPNEITEWDRTAEAYRIASSLDDANPASVLLKQYGNANSIVRRQLQKSGVPSEVITALLRPNKNIDDIRILQNYVSKQNRQ